MKATLSNHHQSPRKVRLVADAIRGKSVGEAKRMLTFMPKYAAPAVHKLLDSALANARQTGVSPEELFVRTITVNKGLVGKRGRPFARGRSGVIRKTMSHITIELGALPARTAKKTPAKVAKIARAKKAAPAKTSSEK